MPFTEALPFVLHEEGGFANDPADPGGATMRGVTQRVYDGWRDSHALPRQSVRDIGPEELHAIYEVQYWREAHCDTVDALGKPRLALCVFDWAVNGGAARARVYLQVAVGVTPDGVIGPKTLAAVASCDEDAACGHYLILRQLHYQARVGDRSALDALRAAGIPAAYLPTPNTSQAKFLVGWLARVRRLRTLLGLGEGTLL